MLNKIIRNSEALLAFIFILRLNMSKPQMRHLVEITDAIITCEGPKTLSRLNRQLLEERDVYSVADFITHSPWNAEMIRKATREALVPLAVKSADIIYISIDDSATPKPKDSLHFEPVDWHKESNAKPYERAVSFVSCHIQAGPLSFAADWRLYMREKTVRQANRKRKKNGQDKIHFRNKISLVKEMLREIAPLIPKGKKVYVVFDSWYASAKLIRFIRRLGYHVICAIKSNRTLDGKQVRIHAKGISNKAYHKVTMSYATSSASYYTFCLTGRITDYKEPVGVIVSKRHPRDKSPEYFLTTDISLSAREVLQAYTHRWPCEVDYLYLKTYLGLGDFRVRSVESISKYFALVFLALQYLQWRLAAERNGRSISTLSDVIRRHREEHALTCTQEICSQVLSVGAAEPLLSQLFRRAA